MEDIPCEHNQRREKLKGNESELSFKWLVNVAQCGLPHVFNMELWGREQHTWDTAHTLLEEMVLGQRKQ